MTGVANWSTNWFVFCGTNDGVSVFVPYVLGFGSLVSSCLCLDVVFVRAALRWLRSNGATTYAGCAAGNGPGEVRSGVCTFAGEGLFSPPLCGSTLAQLAPSAESALDTDA